MPIAKVTVGKGAYGCLNYVLTKDKAELLDTNCAAETPADLAQEFEVALQPHHRNGANRHTENYVAHFSIAFHAELEQTQLTAIAHRFQSLMGFDPTMNQFVLAQHKDTDDCHIHLVANRIRLDGQVVSDSFQQRRTEVAMRTLEEEFGLPRLQNSWEVEVRAPQVAEVRQSRQSGKPIPRRVMQETIERCVVGTETLADLQTKLQASGVTLTATPRDDGSWALLYQLELEGKQRTFSATKLGKRYTKRGLQSTFGISFGAAEVTAETAETAVPVVPLVVLPVETVTAQVTLPEPPNTYPVGFGQEPGNVSAVVESLRQEAVEPATEAEGFGQKPLESPVVPVVPDSLQPEDLELVEATEGFGQKLVDPEAKAARFRHELEQLASQLAATQVNEWTDDLTPVQSNAQTESLNAVLRWTQNHIETLELRAIWLGLQHANDQARWEALAAQAQQRGLSDVRQIETAVTALACQQGYKTKAIVQLLQQSPRVKQALRSHSLAQVQQTLTQSVVQVRQALQQRQRAAALRQRGKG